MGKIINSEYSKDDKVSIVIPVYNTEKYLKDCVTSIINQTYKNIEIILFDDGSKDKSYEIMKKLKDKDARIKVYTRENKGSLYTRLEGVKKSNGKYIMFVDSDDYIEENMIEELLYNVKDADIIRCGWTVENIKKNKRIENKCYDKKIIYEGKNIEELYYEYLTNYKFTFITCQLIKKELFENIKVERKICMCEDKYLNLEIISQVNKIAFIPEAYYHYMIRENSTIHTLEKNKIEDNIRDDMYVHLKDFDYIKRWGVENKEKEILVSNDIIKSAYEILKPLFYIKFSKTEIMGILKEILENKNFEKASKLADKSKMNLLEKELCKKKYKTFYILGTITIKPIYNIKKKIKETLLYCFLPLI